MSKLPEVLRLRKKLCLEIAEQLEVEFKLGTSGYDVDEAADLIDSLIPDTYDEEIARAAAVDEVIARVTQPTGPTLIGQLRDVLGFHDGAPLRDVLEFAIKRLREVG